MRYGQWKYSKVGCDDGGTTLNILKTIEMGECMVHRLYLIKAVIKIVYLKFERRGNLSSS